MGHKLDVSEFDKIQRQVTLETASDPGISTPFQFAAQVQLRSAARAYAAGLQPSVDAPGYFHSRVVDAIEQIVAECRAAGFDPTAEHLLEGVKGEPIHAPSGDTITSDFDPNELAYPFAEDPLMEWGGQLPFVDEALDVYVGISGGTSPMLYGPGTTISWYRIGDTVVSVEMGDPELGDGSIFEGGMSADGLARALASRIIDLASCDQAVAWSLTGLDSDQQRDVINTVWEDRMTQTAFADAPRSEKLLAGYLQLTANDDSFDELQSLKSGCAEEFAGQAGGEDDARALVEQIWNGDTPDTSLGRAVRKALITAIESAAR